MNTGLSDIFNESSVEKLLKNDSSPQTTNLARINTGIAEMLFGRTETPKGIGTFFQHLPLCRFQFGRTETPKGIGTCFSWLQSIHRPWFGRAETPKGIETSLLAAMGMYLKFGRTEPSKEINIPTINPHIIKFQIF